MNGTLHTFYVDTRRFNLLHRYRDTKGWSSEIIDVSQPGQSFSSMMPVELSNGVIKLAYVKLAPGPSSSSPIETIKIATRSTNGTWATTSLPALTKTPTFVWESGAVLAAVTSESSPSTGSGYACEFAVHRIASTSWQRTTVGTTKNSYYSAQCPAYPTAYFLDRSGRTAIATSTLINSATRVVVFTENAQKTYDTAQTPLESLAYGSVAMDAAGVIFIFGESALQHGSRLAIGSGLFWAEEALPSQMQAFSVSPSGTLRFRNLATSSRPQSITQLERTAPNVYTPRPTLMFSGTTLPLASSVNAYTLAPLVLAGFDAAGDPIAAWQRFSTIEGAGYDLIEWPSGLERRTVLDWRDALGSTLDMQIDQQGVPHVLMIEGESKLNLHRLVIRSRTPQGWVTKPVTEPGTLRLRLRRDVPARLRIGTDGKYRVVTVGAVLSSSQWVDTLVLLTEAQAGQVATIDPLVTFNSNYGVGKPDLGQVSFVLDASNAAHIAYTSGVPNYSSLKDYQLSYVTKTPTGLVKEDLLTNTYDPVQRIALLPNGTPIISYVVNESIGFAQRVGGTWLKAASGLSSLVSHELVLNASGAPCFVHVARLTSTTEVRLSCLSGSTFQSTTIFDEYVAILGVGSDAAGTMHVMARQHGRTQNVLFHSTSTGSWTSETAPMLLTNPENARLAVSPTGEHYLAEINATACMVMRR